MSAEAPHWQPARATRPARAIDLRGLMSVAKYVAPVLFVAACGGGSSSGSTESTPHAGIVRQDVTTFPTAIPEASTGIARTASPLVPSEAKTGVTRVVTEPTASPARTGVNRTATLEADSPVTVTKTVVRTVTVEPTATNGKVVGCILTRLPKYCSTSESN